MTSHLSDVYHNSASGIISIDKRQQREKESKKGEKQETVDVPVYLILTFDLRMAQLLALRQNKVPEAKQFFRWM